MSDNEEISGGRRRRRRVDDEDEDEEELGTDSLSTQPREGANIPSSPQFEAPLGSPDEIDFENPDNDGDEAINADEDLEEVEERMNEVDLMGDDMYRDYAANREQDEYEERGVDDEEQEELSLAERRRIDAQLNERDRLVQRNKAYLDDDDEGTGAGGVDLDAMGLPVQRRRRRRQYEEADDDLLSDMDIDPLADELSLESLGDVKASSYSEWITQPNVSRTIARELKSFLLEYTDESGKSVYGARIRTLGEMNSESLEVNYRHLVESKAILALFLAKCPEEMLKIFDTVAMEATQLHYPDYTRIHSEIHVRISDFPSVLNLRALRETHLNSLVRVSGVVTRRTGVFPQLKYVKFNCLKCGAVLGPYYQDSNEEIRISFCTNCRSKGPFRINMEKTLYRNYQRITIQESPGSVPAGRLPRHREVILLWDLVDIAKPGEEVEVTGIYKNTYDGNLNAKNGFPVFATVLEANSVKRREGGLQDGDGNEGLDAFSWTEDEEREFRKMSRDRGIIDKIISSMAPSIYGHRDIKTAIACSLFGGVPKNVNGKHSIRGDINILLLGDPGTAKSQILKYVEKTANRAVFATGQGASAVGLTASVRKDQITKEWTLEGGALVLADKGVCLIDEFDKMNDQDRTSIHEAMEQQSISISKAGIVTTLQARCSIIAAANPIGGRYNSTLPLSQNVNLTEPILSRFDILCVVRDLVDEESDQRLASFVVDSHIRSHPDKDLEDPNDNGNEGGDEEANDNEDRDDGAPLSSKQRRLQSHRRREDEISPIPQHILMKYIHYARTKVYPKLHQMDMDKVSRVYADLRRESVTTGSFPITVRHLESILRIAEAFAKMRLSEFVSSWDLDRAIKVTVDSFVGAQKISVRRQLQRSFAVYTMGTM
ncbi:DNA replication licensing factor MCM2 [Kluyveromyces marxianus]|uniref:DNA replication licensing factor MCM2 n=2 Tax=Kluyveromyces marxianus TaxID=4911 RepID=W0T8R6_KLUMD|nr:DNA replication licensing factor MCM2 [Kluyveromyces marxianus DMKU3-1042]QGN15149.1 DNA replication licensing factor MCM2 [Kluyveromyces marxianus]BAO39433.1 DNA replication licensing factor MCM2 [Kluyveromyces marxianus DMKU3-1042]